MCTNETSTTCTASMVMLTFDPVGPHVGVIAQSEEIILREQITPPVSVSVCVWGGGVHSQIKQTHTHVHTLTSHSTLELYNYT